MQTTAKFGERFLTSPDCLPEPGTGEPWGDRDVTVDIPGGPYRFSGLTAMQEEALRRRLDGFCLPRTTRQAASVEASVFRGKREDFQTLPTRGWVYSLDIDTRPESVRVAGRELLGRIDWTPELTGTLWTSDGEPRVFTSVAENYFRILVAYRLLDCGGVMVHSAGLTDQTGAFLLVGRSGAGKSTISRLAIERDREVLSDDLNAVHVDPRGVWIDRLPFFGDVGGTSRSPSSHRLRAICRLEKGGTNTVRSMSQAEAIASLVACSPGVNSDPYRQDRLVSILDGIVRSVPAFVLTFSLDGGFWDALHASLKLKPEKGADRESLQEPANRP